MSEHNEQSALFEWAELSGIPALRWMFAVPNGGARHIATAVKLHQEGVKRGVPDIMLPVPHGQYHGLFIEMKFGKNKVTPEQEQWLAYLQDVGYMTAVCYSWAEARNVILFYLEVSE